MLVLSRKSQEAVVVGACDSFQHMLKVTVLDVSGSIVKLGFEIDQAVPVHRWEVWERIRSGIPPGKPVGSSDRVRPPPIGIPSELR